MVSNNVKIKTYRHIILPAVLCGCGTWSLALREADGLGVFKIRVLSKITGSREDYVTKSFIICTAHQILLGLSNKEEWDGWGM
jgi:hypothetical protein